MVRYQPNSSFLKVSSQLIYEIYYGARSAKTSVIGHSESNFSKSRNPEFYSEQGQC